MKESCSSHSILEVDRRREEVQDKYSPQSHADNNLLVLAMSHLRMVTTWKSIQIISPSKGLINWWGYSIHDSIMSWKPHLLTLVHLGTLLWTNEHFEYCISKNRATLYLWFYKGSKSWMQIEVLCGYLVLFGDGGRFKKE